MKDVEKYQVISPDSKSERAVFACARNPVCPCARADPEEPSEAVGGAAVAAAAERAAPRGVGPALRLRLLPPARLRRSHRLGTQHPQETRSPGRRAGRAGGHRRPPRQLSDGGSEWLSSPVIAQNRYFFKQTQDIFLGKWHKDMKTFMRYHRTTGNAERPRVLYGATTPCATAFCSTWQ